MREKEILKSQVAASLDMLRQAIEQCPQALWQDRAYKNPFWHVAYHAIFYTHFYLHPSENEYVPWEKHQARYVSLEESPAGSAEIPDKEEVLAYLRFCLEQMEILVDGLDLQAESGFYWLPCDKLELQIYSIRHIMQHVGELYERLAPWGDVELGWVGMKSADRPS
ncbi:MAG: DinB family protein [Anaerolineales bacterium]|nr:DinB family protein [Anaerolineales bacterium]